MAQTTIDLSGAQRAADAAALRATLADALAGGDVQITTAGLASIDSAIVQVLLSAFCTARKTEHILQIDTPEAGALANLLDRLALRTVFGSPPA
ncbi:STAS domain-containing protein [Pseudotabrizicola algicola]|uniref:STAS domain-containing protein n=1 Tax=Pseudotabrizicola algicola TaxID=2709381 RepID=A0A6B3RLU8_9RHOB|nr:STAS domain-containing protein [Pseudotabrizicola algicola]NEX46153.1 STAS domain-containing protein [Pseudotabrizicola algicola]